MDWKSLFQAHIEAIAAGAAQALDGAAKARETYDGIVFHAGSAELYHDDDQDMPFRHVFHFGRYAPVGGPDHLLFFKPGTTPRLARVVPRDYWYEEPSDPDHPYAEVLDVTVVDSVEAAILGLEDVSRWAYVGNDPMVAGALEIPESAIEPEALMSWLDWDRGVKTAYEVECTRQSLARAAKGHQAVRDMVAPGADEREMHVAYLTATQMLENQTPYTNIIGWDENAATLHYQSKDTNPPRHGFTLLIDAGADCFGYASDITRTYLTDKAHPVFIDLLDRMEALQLELCAGVGPGRSYIDLHDNAHRQIATALCETGVLKTDADAAYTRGLTRPFFPHGLGHHLGLQVHDVGGHQEGPAGGTIEPPDHHPFLRTTRDMAAGNILTVEPGLYFIPMLLEEYRDSSDADAFDWTLIEQLIPCGGIRIEDNVLCTDSGYDNLSRPFIPGHRGQFAAM